MIGGVVFGKDLGKTVALDLGIFRRENGGTDVVDVYEVQYGVGPKGIVTSTRKLTYLVIPASIRVRPQVKPVTPYLRLGPELDVLLSARKTSVLHAPWSDG